MKEGKKMKLSTKQIKEITLGAVRFEETEKGLAFHRFTKEQSDWYARVNPNFYIKSLSPAGVKLSFKTDSERLFLKLETVEGVSRWYFSADVYVDGKIAGYLDNMGEEALPRKFAFLDQEDERFSQNPGIYFKEFSLGKGEKTVCVHLPWSTQAFLSEMEVDDGAFVEAVKPGKKALVFGDSITHGYDALRPSNRYPAKLCEALVAEEINKAIGGERFKPELAAMKDAFVPDFITVAYGTNDWSCNEPETFREDCKAFYKNLRENYPGVKIFAITPIWRKDKDVETQCGPFKTAEKFIREAAESLENVMVIDGMELVPHDENLYGDLRLHPNDEGFAHYAKNLYEKIKKEI